MPDDSFRVRPLHRQRGGRRKPVRVLDQGELARLLRVQPEQVGERLTELGWRFHCDPAGRIWATEQALPEDDR
jgi:hypothetical protein